MNSTYFKRFFKAMGIPVRVRTCGSFFQIWISPVEQNNHLALLKYAHEFPLELRQRLLRGIYGQGCTFAEGGNAGNVRPYSLVISKKEWESALVEWMDAVEKV